MPLLDSNLSAALAALALLLFGCNNKPEQPGTVTQRSSGGIPKGALLVGERTGKLALTGVPAPGTAYIQDHDTGKVIFTTPIKPGDQLLFWPERDHILLNGAVVREDAKFDEKHVHRLYFLKG